MPAFRLLQPGRRMPERLVWFLLHHPRIRRFVEERNMRLSDPMKTAHAAVRPLGLMDRMSSLPVGMLVNELVRRMAPGHAYVNVGVWKGFTLFAGMAGNENRTCIGVDDFSQFDERRFGYPREEFLAAFRRLRAPAHVFHETTYEAYLRDVHRGPIGVFLYDGDHAHGHQVRSLELAEPFFVTGSIVVIDDLNYPDVRRAMHDFFNRRADGYDILLDRETANGGHPTLWNGLLIARRR